MAAHQGRAEVARRKQRLTATFAAIDGAGLGSELTSHFSRYLCVLVSGYAEQSVKELVAHYCRTKSNEPIQRYVGKQLGRLRNIDLEKLKQLVESFQPEWWVELEDKRADELSAFTSVATVRNAVSHGGDAGITMATIKQYFGQISVVLDDLCDRFDPV
ncbi:HEPN domain-containing protein [Blastococcus sp. SYSU DS0619]